LPVSRQTVSNVLNGSGRVGDAARARVLAAVEALGYYPQHGARSLRSRRTRQVAYVMPRLQLLPGNYLMQQFLQSLAAACTRRNNSLVVVVPEGDPRDEMRRLIASRSVDAFLLSELQPDDPRVKLLTEAGMPFACFGRTGPALPQNWVDIDNRGAVAAAVEHVLARGFGGSPSPATGRRTPGIPSGPPGSGTDWPPPGSPPTRPTCCWWTRATRTGRSGRCCPEAGLGCVRTPS
jgi:DNA-binding LacI/PurR family transcriptional regulator